MSEAVYAAGMAGAKLGWESLRPSDGLRDVFPVASFNWAKIGDLPWPFGRAWAHLDWSQVPGALREPR